MNVGTRACIFFRLLSARQHAFCFIVASLVVTPRVVILYVVYVGGDSGFIAQTLHCRNLFRDLAEVFFLRGWHVVLYAQKESETRRIFVASFVGVHTCGFVWCSASHLRR